MSPHIESCSPRSLINESFELQQVTNLVSITKLVINDISCAVSLQVIKEKQAMICAQV